MNGNRDGERRKQPLSPQQLERVATRAAEILAADPVFFAKVSQQAQKLTVAEIFQQIGKGVVRRLFVIAAVGVVSYAYGKGWIKL